jgi:DUF3073 family protein
VYRAPRRVKLCARHMQILTGRRCGGPVTNCEGVDPMGRGRAKAKQTKVARELKYREFNTDFTELQRELHGDAPDSPPGPEAEAESAEDPYADDPYAEYDGSSSATGR